MKKILALILAGVITFSLAACSEKNEESSQPSEPDSIGDVMEIRDITSVELVSEMKLGWSLGNTLDATGGSGLSTETSWGNPVTTKEMIDVIANEGFNVLRLPVTWEGHFDEETYEINEEWLNRVQEVVDYGIDNEMFVILNVHHESWNYPYEDNYEKASSILVALWEQIAFRFQGYDEHLIFEGMNEPRKVGTAMEWNGGDTEGWDVVNKLNADFVNTIRSAEGNNPKRHLMIPTYAASSTSGAMNALEIPDDDKIIVSLHAYTPYQFALSDSDKDSFSVDNANDTREIDQLMKLIDDVFVSNGQAVIIGEFGARQKGQNTADRAAWAEYYTQKAAEIGVPCVLWDNNVVWSSGENFGMLDRAELKFYYPEIVDALFKGIENVKGSN